MEVRTWGKSIDGVEAIVDEVMQNHYREKHGNKRTFTALKMSSLVLRSMAFHATCWSLVVRHGFPVKDESQPVEKRWCFAGKYYGATIEDAMREALPDHLQELEQRWQDLGVDKE